MGELTSQQLSLLVIMAVTFGVLMSERLRNDLVALLIVLSLTLSGVLEPKEALAGFGSEPAIVVAAIFVLSAAFHLTGLSDIIGRWIGQLAGSSYNRIIGVIMPSVALLSAFTHHLTTTAIMLPVTLNLCRERGIAPSKLLIPLSFAASLGTTITIIGAPAFLIASSVLQQSGRPGLGIFSIAPIGLSISLAGTLFMLLFGKLLLPDRKGSEDASARFRLDEYFTELVIKPTSPLIDQTVEQIENDDRYSFKVVGWIRNQRHIRRPFGERRLEAGDVLLIRTSPEQLVAIREEPDVELRPVEQYGTIDGQRDADSDITEQLVQAIVAPESDLVNRTIAEINFHERYGAIVVSLWRRRSWLQRELSKIKLQPGDVLVLQGDEEALNRVANDRAFLMLIPFHGEGVHRRKATLAGAIMLLVVLLSAFNVLSIEIAALAGAIGVVLSRCISSRQAYQAIDGRIYVFIAGAVPLGAAMQKTGTAEVIAVWLQGTIGGWNEIMILLTLFLLVGILTQFMSDSATTALFAPVAAALAQTLGHSPEAYVVTVAMASVASFFTPIGHHGNLLVYGPGGYQFSDFVRSGTPLTILVGVIVALLAPVLWPR